MDKDNEWTAEEEAATDKEFAAILTKHNVAACPVCGRQLDRGDVSWNNPATEAGTPYSILQITCQNCGTEILHLESWQPWIEDFQGFVRALRRDWL